jgi:hypothetical protein
MSFPLTCSPARTGRNVRPRAPAISPRAMKDVLLDAALGGEAVVRQRAVDDLGLVLACAQGL